jgi:DNA polymerase I-like protein with 3'-5' exonuclease and polymerase domains
VSETELAEMGKLASELMSTALELSVPLKVDIKTGPNWGEMK